MRPAANTVLLILALAAVSMPITCTACGDLQWPESRLALACMPGLKSPVENAVGCTIYRACTTGPINKRPYASICNVTKIFTSLCLDYPSALPECARAGEQLGEDFRTCLLDNAFSIWNTTQVMADMAMNCDMMGGRPMVGCPECGSMEECRQQADPFLLYGQHCLHMAMIGCQDWSKFCSMDAAGPNSTSGIAFAAECIKPTVAVPPTPAPAPMSKSPCLKNPLARSWCKHYRYPSAALTANVESLCGNLASTIPACKTWQGCQANNSVTGVCEPFVLLASLCSTAPSQMACSGYSTLCQMGPTIHKPYTYQCRDSPPNMDLALFHSMGELVPNWSPIQQSPSMTGSPGMDMGDMHGSMDMP